MTEVYAAAGEDGRLLAWPLLAAAARQRWGWTALPPVERSPRGKPLFAVDVEVVRSRRTALPGYVLGAEELKEFDGSWEDFYRLWTRKESWCKREDIPLYPSREVVPPPGCCGSIAGEGWRGAVCCHGVPPDRVVWLAPEELPEQGRA